MTVIAKSVSARPTAASTTPTAKASPAKPARTAKASKQGKPLPTGLPLMIGLDQLAADPVNVRPDAGDVSELAASIAAHGVIQPLAVRPEMKPDKRDPSKPGHPTGRYLVVAGGRRLRALMKLAADRRLPKDAGVPCVVRQDSERDATEVSLAENVERVPMNAADEHAAFARLADSGMSSRDIAARFGLHKRRVEQRLALGRIAPDLLDELRKGSMTAAVAQALTLTTSHDRQRDVWRQCKGGWNAETQVRRLITEQSMSFDDPMLRLVGRAAYERAGGPVRFDLFAKEGEDEAGFAEDTSLVRKLAAAKLDAEAEQVKAGPDGGWAFVVHELQEDADPFAYRREQPTRREATKDEAERRAEVERELTAMEDEGWDEATPEGRAAAERFDRLEAELEDLDARREQWTSEQRARCGVHLSVGEGGRVEQRRGLVDPAWDKKQREEAEARRAGEQGGDPAADAGSAVTTTPEAKQEGPAAAEVGAEVELPRTLVWKLTKARTEALRASMIQNPAASADLLVAHLCERLFFGVQFASRDPLPLEVQVSAGRDDFHPGTGRSEPSRGSHGTEQTSEAQTVFYEALQAWRSRLPATPDQLPTFVAGLSGEERTSLMGLLAAASLNTVTEAAEVGYGGKSNAGIARLAEHVGCDVTRWWRPTAESFFGGLTKAGIAAALDEAMLDTYGKRLSPAAGVDGLKKDAAAGRAEALMSKLAWLPRPLRVAHRPRMAEAAAAADAVPLPAEEAAEPAKLAA